MVSNNINTNSRLIFKGNEQYFSSSNPVMQGQITQQSVAQSSPAMDMFVGDLKKKDKPLVLGLTVASMLGLYKSLDLFARVNNGEYEKSLVGRLANLGDKIAEKFNKTTVGSSINKFMQIIHDRGQALINKNKTLYAMFRTPSVPENKLVLDQAKMSTQEQLSNEFIRFVEKYTKSKKNNITDLGLTEAEFDAIKKNPIGNIDKMKEICKKVGNSKSIKLDNFLGKITGRTVTLEQIGNQLRAITESKSCLGRILPKCATRGLYALTFGGGVFMLLSAISLAKAVPKTRDADKGDKIPTFMDEFLSNISWVITLPLGIKLMNAVGGLANRGRTIQQNKAYEEAFKNAKEMSKNKAFATKAEYDAAWENVKNLKNAGVQKGFWNKLITLPGRILTYGRRVKYPFIDKNATTFTQKMGNFMKKIPYSIRNYPVAYILGLATYMMAFSPIVEKLFTGASHLVFGKPKHANKYEEEVEKEKENANATLTNEQPMINQEQAIDKSQPLVVNDSPTNLINMKRNGQAYQEKTATKNVVNEADLQQDTDGKTLEPVRTYIPSPNGVIVQENISPAANDALMRSDYAKKAALESLAMKL